MWQVPYPVRWQVGPVIYEIDVIDRRKRKRILQANMLHKWSAPAGDAYWSEEIADRVDDAIPTWDKGSVPKGVPVLGNWLNVNQQGEI